jgi:hypothetical protein
MNKTATVIAVLVVVFIIIGLVIFVVPKLAVQLGGTQITLPNGQWVQYKQYSLSFAPASDPRNFAHQDQLWVSPSNTEGETETFPVVQGATYTAFDMRITISEVHSDYLVVSIK